MEEYRLSQFIKKHISTLFSMQLKVFEKYLESCFFKHKNMQETKSLKWIYDENEAFVDHHTSYLGDEFYQKLLNYKEKKNEKTPKKKARIQQNPDKAHPEKNHISKEDDSASPSKVKIELKSSLPLPE